MIFSRLLTVVETSATDRAIDVTSNLTLDKLLDPAVVGKCCQMSCIKHKQTNFHGAIVKYVRHKGEEVNVH